LKAFRNWHFTVGTLLAEGESMALASLPSNQGEADMKTNTAILMGIPGGLCWRNLSRQVVSRELAKASAFHDVAVSFHKKRKEYGV
jgi:hypothetical protein